MAHQLSAHSNFKKGGGLIFNNSRFLNIHAQMWEALADKRESDEEALEIEEQKDQSVRSQYVISGLDWVGLALSYSVHTKIHGFPNGYMLYFFPGSSNK